MKNTKFNHVIEYLSPTLVLSYFLIHNISLVLIGIALSLYLININFIYRIIKSSNEKLLNKKESIDLNVNDKEIKTNHINKKSTKEGTKLTLVETIEELGFIPTLDENDESNAA